MENDLAPTEYELRRGIAGAKTAKKFGSTKGNVRGKNFNAFDSERHVVQNGADGYAYNYNMHGYS